MIPNWTRFFRDADHRWIMGLRQGDSLADYFADADPTNAIRAERGRWLADDPHKYAALLPESEPALEETVELARSWGVPIDVEKTPFEQLLALGRAWEPDFLWMHPSADGVHRLIGGVVCFPSSWALQEKLGRPMTEVHDLVPGLNDALGRQIEMFLAKQIPGAVWRRENWGLSRDAELNHHPSRPRRRLDATITAADVWIRLEHQLLLKLPRSGSVLFGIRVEPVPLSNVIADPQAATCFARILSTLTPASAAYKDVSTAGPALIAMLQRGGGI
jgi:heme-dependent oxidative N-demethylase alpha subunit-like protein